LQGFGMGCGFEAEVWDHAEEDVPELFKPIKDLVRVKVDGEGWDDACIDAGVALVGLRDYFRSGAWREAFEEVQQPFVREGPKVGRNDPCPCGSGRKFKQCCMRKS